jgi:putative SOS response-associated peptidase YedK
MCGRFTLRTSEEVLARYFQATGIPTFRRRYNVAPTQTVLAVRQAHGERQWALLRWGLVPSWAKDVKGMPLNINARAETVATTPSFRTAFKRRRCLIPADGFYEWSGAKGNRQATFFSLKDDKLFAFAGLWERWEHDGAEIESCALITTEPNELVKSVHNRMPVILTDAACDAWINEGSESGELQDLLKPLDADRMTLRKVAAFVNNARNEGEACLAEAS